MVTDSYERKQKGGDEREHCGGKRKPPGTARTTKSKQSGHLENAPKSRWSALHLK